MKSTPKSGAPARSGAGRSGAGGRSTGGSGGGTTTRTANARATMEFFRGIVQEMRRVTWPTREEWIAATILTIALVVGVGFFTYFVDLLLAWVFSLLTGGPR
jgi:preprotein translocase SecE subunit